MSSSRSGQKRGVFHLGRCYLKGRDGAANAILSAAGYNLRLVIT